MKRRFPQRLNLAMLRGATQDNVGMKNHFDAVFVNHFDENEVVAAWRTVLGPTLVRYSENLEFRERMLYVRITSPMLRNDLFMQRSALIEKLNAAIGRHLVNGIVFR